MEHTTVRISDVLSGGQAAKALAALCCLRNKGIDVEGTYRRTDDVPMPSCEQYRLCCAHYVDQNGAADHVDRPVTIVGSKAWGGGYGQ